MDISIKDLWIGDELQLIKSGRPGRYDGTTKDGKIRIKIDENKIIKTTLKNVKPYTPPKEKIKLQLGKELNKTVPYDDQNFIDLHIKVLAPHLENQPSVRILDYQISAIELFLDNAYSRHLNIVQIIHGKGEGVLRTEIRHRLRSDPRVKLQIDINDGGATEVWLAY